MENNRKQKRNSILKVRQETNLIDETTVVMAPNANRRVSFHQVKHVKEYDRDHGKIIDATPIKEKAFDTMSSDGTSTPHTTTRVDMDITGDTTMPTRVFVEEGSSTPRNSAHFAHHNDGTMDMSMDNSTITNLENQNETARLLDVTREKTMVYEKTTTTTMMMETTTRITVVEGVDDTMALFNMTNRDDVEMEIEGGGGGGAGRVDDTISLFNTTNTDQIDMDITQQQEQKPLDDTMAVFRSPAPPRIQKTPSLKIQKTPRILEENSESMDMDISKIPAQDDTLSLFKSPKKNEDMMEISGIQKTDSEDVVEEAEPGSEAMDITVAPGAAPDDTMEAFTTPKRIQKSQNPEDMILETTVMVNETFDLLQSPARAKIQNLEHQQILEHPEDHVDMDITQREVEPTDSTMALFRSPEKIPATTQNQSRQVFEQDDSMDIESTLQPSEETPEDVPPPESPSEDVKPSESSTMMSMATEEASMVVVEEERCTVSTMLQMSPIGRQEEEYDDVEIQNQQLQNPLTMTSSEMSLSSSSIHNSSVTLNVSKTPVTSEVSQIQIQTMILETDTTNSVQNLTSEDVAIQKEEDSRISKDQEDSIMDMSKKNEGSRISNVSRIRRSLLLDPSMMCRESPRRLALENSMLSMSTVYQGGGGALAEYRQHKLNESLESTGGNQTLLTNLTATGRDIFKMNTSIRSPAHRAPTNTTMSVSTPDTPSNVISILPPKSPESSFRLPQFDAAIVNVIYLTPEDVRTQEPIPEAFEFQKLLAQEEANAHQEIEKAVNGDEHVQKMVDESGKDFVKIGHLERDVIGIARGQAEQKFLEIRGRFAQEQVVKSNEEIIELEIENSKLAQRIQDARNVNVLRRELAELQKQPTREEASKIRKEHHELKMEGMRIHIAAIKARYAAEIELREQRKKVEDGLEEKREILARLEEQEEKRREEMVRRVRAIVPGL